MKIVKQKGFTLIELLVAVLINALLMVVLINVFLTNKQSYSLHEALMSIQERGSFAQHLLTSHLRMAGYIGCANNKTDSVKGYHITGDRSMLPADICHKVLSGTDVLFLQRASEENVSLINMTTTSLMTTATNILAANDMVLIADCNQGDIFQLKQVIYDDKNKWQFLQSKKPLKNHYQQHALISKHIYLIFYIADTGRKNSVGNPIYALFCKDLYADKKLPTEMIEGIENLVIEYGIIDKKDFSVKFYQATVIKDWSQVVSVKFLLLLTSIEPCLNRSSQYQFAGKNYQAQDLRLHQQWQGQVTLRQRIH